jgi:O-acetyl-ADP-ribose deacetylase (regulator of RNase III)
MIKHDGPGDLFESKCKTIVCPVNIVGVMGKGLALEFSKRFKGLKEHYQKVYPKVYRPDYRLLNHLEIFPVNENRQVLLFPTKIHYSNPSKISWIEDNLKLATHLWHQDKYESVAFPAIGCGEGGLPFKQVRKRIIQTFGDSRLDVELYWPKNPPQ